MTRSLKELKERDLKQAWRSWASQPLAEMRIDSRKIDGEIICTLYEGEREIGRWRNADMPQLFPCLAKLIAALHGAWHVAQPQLRSLRGATVGGKRTGKQTTLKARKTKAKIADVAKGFDPMKKAALAAMLEERDPALGKASSIEKKLPPALKKR